MVLMGDRFLSSAGTEGNCALSMTLPNPSAVLDKDRAPMGPEVISSTGTEFRRQAPKAVPDSSSVLDKLSTPNMTGRRFHRTMEMIPRLPLVV